MNNQRNTAPFSDVSHTELFVYLLSAPLLLAFIGGVAAAQWTRVLACLLRHHIVLPASAHPLLRVPQAHGAGLDFGRITIVVGVLIALLTVTIACLRRPIARMRAAAREEER